MLYAATGGALLFLCTAFGCFAAYGRRSERKKLQGGLLQGSEDETAPTHVVSSSSDQVSNYESMPNQLYNEPAPEPAEDDEEDAYRKLIASYGLNGDASANADASAIDIDSD
jgi:hypothetical protein